MKKIKHIPSGVMRVKLIVDQGFAERPVYSIKATTNEKEKGINMIELTSNIFSISNKDMMEAVDRKLKEWDLDSRQPTIIKGTPQVKWTRDERGNIVSPFKKKEPQSQDSFK